jgi:phosphotransferase system enzyme I (PtsI)
VRQTVDGIVAQLAQAPQLYFRERAGDVGHVGERILRSLTGSAVVFPKFEGPTILVASDLSPADAALLIRQPIEALVVSDGSATSHTAILARTLEIPAVVGVAEIMRLVGTGDLILVDALRGEVVLEPDEAERDRAEERSRRFKLFTGKLRARRGVRTETRDGARIDLSANIELPAEAAIAVEEGADGVGLYRTEFLYLDRETMPTEEEQLQVYSDVVRVLAPRPVIFRTYDLGGDKLPLSDRQPRGPNPALGLRAIRLALARPDLLRAQVRAVLRAAVYGPVKLMLPLVTCVDEVRQARALIESWRAELEVAGIDHRPVPIGIMIEVPSAVVMADVLARECDFFSVGTNDLVQYALALDRTNPQVAYLARTLDPAILRLLHMTVVSARMRELPITMCGDMASDPIALPLVLGLGFRSLSMPTGAIPLAREIIARVDTQEAHECSMRALACTTADEVEKLVVGRFRKTLGEVWSEQEIDH